MKLAHMLSNIQENHTDARRIFQAARDGFMTAQMDAKTLTRYGVSLENEYFRARDFASRFGTKSTKVWDLIREMSEMLATIRGYADHQRSHEATA